jgi:hypothetical protein
MQLCFVSRQRKEKPPPPDAGAAAKAYRRYLFQIRLADEESCLLCDIIGNLPEPLVAGGVLHGRDRRAGRQRN